MRDYNDQRGPRNHMARVPDSTVRKARAMYRQGLFGYGRIAQALGVKKSTARQWCNGTMRGEA